MANSPLSDDCPKCGADSDARAFVHYEAAPNDAQQECDWADDLPDCLHAFICTECSFVLGTVDARDPEDLPDVPDDTTDYRVDEELR